MTTMAIDPYDVAAMFGVLLAVMILCVAFSDVWDEDDYD